LQPVKLFDIKKSVETHWRDNLEKLQTSMDFAGRSLSAGLEKMQKAPADRIARMGVVLVAPIIVDQMARRAGVMVPPQSKLGSYYQRNMGMHS